MERISNNYKLSPQHKTIIPGNRVRLLYSCQAHPVNVRDVWAILSHNALGCRYRSSAPFLYCCFSGTTLPATRVSGAHHWFTYLFPRTLLVLGCPMCPDVHPGQHDTQTASWQRDRPDTPFDLTQVLEAIEIPMTCCPPSRRKCVLKQPHSNRTSRCFVGR